MTDDQPPGARPRIDTTVPHSARIWNYWLCGRDNYEVDRAAGDRFRATFPGITQLARASRGFLARSIAYLAGPVGIRQFIDIGAGLPTADNTHEIAQRIAPDSRVVYVDNDPLVLAHARALLVSGPQGATDYVDADVHEPEKVLDRAGTLVDFAQPVGLILSGVLGHVSAHAEALAIVRRLMAGLPSGSHLSLNDGTCVLSDEFAHATREYNATGAVPYHLRQPEEIADFFDGLKLVTPGVVSVPRWRPERRSRASIRQLDSFGGVGRKP